ncbi:MAG: hypothetical protein JW944_12020 [Deltaproteobacteria bacterium]|nr:hypothetical protein [Deltaproteobacteria bacterium]
MDIKKQQRIDEVKALLEGFAKANLSHEISGYVLKLWDMIGRKRNYIITGGKKEVWASAVIYAIARLNFLFDCKSKDYLPPDTIVEFFGTKKSTVASKASEIEKVCRIHMGHEGFCRQEISDSFSFVQLSNGMVLSKDMAKKMGVI